MRLDSIRIHPVKSTAIRRVDAAHVGAPGLVGDREWMVVDASGEMLSARTVPQLFRTPRHPYTGALLAAIPEHSKGAERLQTLPGVVPGAWDRPAGCLLGPRCPFARPDCHAKRPSLVTTPQGESRCYYPLAYPEVV